MPLAHLAQQRKVLTRQHEHRELHDVLDAKPVRGKTCANVPERELGLLRERARHGTVGAHPDLAGDEHQLGAGRHYGCVRVRTDGGVNVAWVYKGHARILRRGEPERELQAQLIFGVGGRDEVEHRQEVAPRVDAQPLDAAAERAFDGSMR